MAPDTGDAAPQDRLDSWKEIAAFLGRGVTTVQRWEQEEHLPVHRHAHAKRGSVFALKSELEHWRRGRSIDPVETEQFDQSIDDATARPAPDDVFAQPPPTESGAAPLPARRNRYVTLAAIAVLATSGLGMILSRSGVDRSGLRSSSAVPRPLASDVSTETYPSLSPDGSFVAYRWSRPDAPGIYITPTSGGTPWALRLDDSTTTPTKDSFPKWSPDGKWIAFLRERGNSIWDVRVVASAGGSSKRVTEIASGSVSWMPDGDTLAIVDRPAIGDPYSVFLVSVATGERRQRITSPPPGTFGDWHCAVSPDGTKLAVARFRSDFDADLYVTTVAAGEAGMTRLTSDAVGLGQLAWTPDGRSIVFASYRTGRASIWEVSLEPTQTGPPRLVAGADGGAEHPTLSNPLDGSSPRLVYNLNNAASTIWRWDLGRSPSGEPHAVVATGVGSDDHPSWSPDGARIAFASRRSGPSEVWVANADGSAATRLTFRDGPLTLQPRWSPDGQWILFTSIDAGHQRVYKIKVDGTQAAPVTNGASDERNAAWSRDGRWIYFRSNRGGGVRVWRTEADRKLEPVPATDGASTEAIESLDGQVLYFTKPFDAGLWQKPLPDGPETLLVPDWHVREGYWDVTRDGILVLDRQLPGSTVRQPVLLFSFSTGALVSLGTIPALVTQVHYGISARPDGTLLWSQTELRFSDLMMLDWAPGTAPAQK